MVDVFLRDATMNSVTIAEMVILGPVLDREHYRKLLSYTISEFEFWISTSFKALCSWSNLLLLDTLFLMT